MHIIQLVVGEDRSTTREFPCHLTRKVDVQKHYQKASKNLGVDITKYCQEEFNSQIPAEVVEALRDVAGGVFRDIEIEPSDSFLLSSEEYAECYIAIFNSLDSKVRLTPLELPRISIGGYGVF